MASLVLDFFEGGPRLTPSALHRACAACHSVCGGDATARLWGGAAELQYAPDCQWGPGTSWRRGGYDAGALRRYLEDDLGAVVPLKSDCWHTQINNGGQPPSASVNLDSGLLTTKGLTLGLLLRMPLVTTGFSFFSGVGGWGPGLPRASGRSGLIRYGRVLPSPPRGAACSD